MYPTFEDFWWGKRCAKITVNDIQVPKLATAGCAGVMNHAFVTFYKAYRNAAEPYPHDYTDAIRKDLHKAAAEGNYISSGGSWEAPDLKGSFHHLAKNKGQWKDDTTQGWGGYYLVPSGIYNFLAAVEKRGRALSGEYNDWKRYMDQAKILKEQNKWEELGKQIGYAKKVIDASTPKLWAYIGVNKEQGASYTKLMSSWLGYGAKVHEYATKAMKAESLYWRARNEPNALKQEIAIELAAYIVGKAPMFGSLYQEVIRGIPGLMRFAQKYADQVNDYIRLANG